VLVNGEEYSFGAQHGISVARGRCASHEPVGGQPTVVELGFTSCAGKEMWKMLSPYFQRGTYDLLAKNCNTFSDCALFVLMKQRLDPKYNVLERLSKDLPTLVNLISGGKYRPNPRAADFQIDTLIEKTLSDCSAHIQRVRSSLKPEPVSLLRWPSSLLDPCLGAMVKEDFEEFEAKDFLTKVAATNSQQLQGLPRQPLDTHHHSCELDEYEEVATQEVQDLPMSNAQKARMPKAAAEPDSEYEDMPTSKVPATRMNRGSGKVSRASGPPRGR
jgi:hypothetical protein